MMKQAIDDTTRAGHTALTTEVALSDLPLSLHEAVRKAEKDAAMDAEDILTQAEEANALNPVG